MNSQACLMHMLVSPCRRRRGQGDARFVQTAVEALPKRRSQPWVDIHADEQRLDHRLDPLELLLLFAHLSFSSVRSTNRAESTSASPSTFSLVGSCIRKTAPVS